MTPLRLLLNSPFTGANAFIALAEQRGLYRAAGLEMQYTSGHGAYTAASRLADEGLFDAAYGDLNALIELAAQRPHDDLPVAVFGQGGGAFKTGRHVRFEKETPLTNLYLAMLNAFGAPTPKMADSTGVLEI